MAERIVAYAKSVELIHVPPKAGVQAGLNALAATPEFDKILWRVANQRGCVYEQVFDRTKHLYDEVSKHAHGNDMLIVVRAIDFIPNECAAVIAYLELQSTWKWHLDWIVEEKPLPEGREKKNPPACI